MSNKYYIVDYGKDMVELAQVAMNYLNSKNYNVIVYLTDLPDHLMISEVNELQFLIHGNSYSEN